MVGGGGGGTVQESLWEQSGHADATAEAFIHWDEDGEVPAACAKCHNTLGFLDFVGADQTLQREMDANHGGTAPGNVPIDPLADNVLECDVCHNSQTFIYNTVYFPPGASDGGMMVTGLGREAFCMECHQGRESTISVDAAIADAAPADEDTVSTDLSFKNVHYFAAAATQYGGIAMGGYQYTGKMYDIKFAHVEGIDTCIVCHNPHSLAIELETCNACHAGLQSEADLADIRLLGSTRDYDGDGNVTEGIDAEIDGLRQALMGALQQYAALHPNADCIAYDAASYPYFFKDANCNGLVDEGEGKYTTWTSRMLKAAYNYHFSLKDPGAFAHNGKYVIELLYDSIESLNLYLSSPALTDYLLTASRIDAGHFAGSEEAWRHWDADGEVSSSCSKCHSATGLPYYLANGTTQAEPVSNGMLCSTCHNNVPNYSQQRMVSSVTFPSGAVIDSGDNTTNLCMTCHQGRESTVSVDAALAGKPDDTVDASISFKNVHYFAAGATRYGTEAQGGYEYAGQVYDGWFPHATTFSACNDCHSTHDLGVKVNTCGECHEGVATAADLEKIRMAGSTVDYDGDGNTTEGIKAEIESLQSTLLTAIQIYAAVHPNANDIAYDPHGYPYFFNDTNGNGIVDASENTAANKYSTWTPRLLRAAYNYQYVMKDPGGFAHNAKYIIELLYDSAADLGSVSMAGKVRNDVGHFDATSEAFRHWDEDGGVSGSCAKCHAPPYGLDYYLQNGVDPVDPMPVSYGLTCDTCHTGVDYAGTAPRKYVGSVTFPSGILIANNPATPDDSFLCMTCHQGREAKSTIDNAIAGGSYSFRNVHYLPAGAILYGSQAVVGYEYPGKSYAGKFNHFTPEAAQCVYCHEIDAEAHTFHPVLKTPPEVSIACVTCHTEVSGGDIETIRLVRSTDYDGDSNTSEKLKDEIDALSNAVYAQMQTYAATTLGTALVYDESTYPYFFIDTNGNGVLDSGENTYSNRFTAWDPALMKAAHNFQISIKEPGAWAHNTNYIAQLLIDSIENLGGAVGGFNRP
ncbi:MAG: hypothetical protein Kow0099_16090 [Candidatus Abyssubacteria bacterium]